MTLEAPPATLPLPSHTPTLPTTASRDNNFDALRFLMALLVVFSHCFPFTLGHHDDFEPLHILTRGRTTFGGLAVDVFFVISGFLVTMSFLNSRSPWSYLKKRIARIYPGYIAASLVCAFLIAPLFISAGQAWMTTHDFLHLLKCLPDLSEYKLDDPGVFANNPFPNSMYGIVWTIKYEFLCYLLVLTLGVTRILRRPAIILALFALSLTIYTAGIQLHYPHWLQRIINDPGAWPQLMTFYLAGMLVYLYRHQVPIKDSLAIAAAILLAASLFLLQTLPIALATAGTYLVFYAAFQKHLAVPRFAKYGDFSYGIYLYGFPVQQILVALLPPMSPLQLFVLAAPLTIAVGTLSWHLAEKWFLQKARRNDGIPLTAAPSPQTAAAPAHTALSPPPPTHSTNPPAPSSAAAHDNRTMPPTPAKAPAALRPAQSPLPAHRATPPTDPSPWATTAPSFPVFLYMLYGPRDSALWGIRQTLRVQLNQMKALFCEAQHCGQLPPIGRNTRFSHDRTFRSPYQNSSKSLKLR